MVNEIYEWLSSLLPVNNWKPLRSGQIPRWVINKAVAFYNKQPVRPYDRNIYFKGNNNIYKIWFETIRQGEVKFHYYRKSRTH